MGSLHLTRKAKQRILIGNDIIVEVNYIEADKHVSLRVTAPPDITILREEIKHRQLKKAPPKCPLHKSCEHRISCYIDSGSH